VKAEEPLSEKVLRIMCVNGTIYTRSKRSNWDKWAVILMIILVVAIIVVNAISKTFI